jgi:hypothetical protein
MQNLAKGLEWPRASFAPVAVAIRDGWVLTREGQGVNWVDHCFAIRNTALVSVREKIVTGQLADLGLQRRHLHRRRSVAAAAKYRRGALNQLALPRDHQAGRQLALLA